MEEGDLIYLLPMDKDDPIRTKPTKPLPLSLDEYQQRDR